MKNLFKLQLFLILTITITSGCDVKQLEPVGDDINLNTRKKEITITINH